MEWFAVFLILLALALLLWEFWWLFGRKPKQPDTSAPAEQGIKPVPAAPTGQVAGVPVAQPAPPAPTLGTGPAAPEARIQPPAPVAAAQATAPELGMRVPAAPPAAPPRKPDDLTIVEGIGPKIAGWLQAAGITGFAELAATDPADIAKILAEHGHRLADPGTWPAQAKLAAAGAWDALQALQGDLKGGRRS